MNIIPELNLNKHPKDIKNNSLVAAENVMISNDNSLLQTENLIVKSKILNNINNINIIYALPCNKEILFFNLKDNNTIDIIRFNEENGQYKTVLTGFEYNNGKLLGTFTYNKGNLIVAISEYNANIDVPLKTINFGSWEDTIIQDLQKTIIVPEVKIPTININYISGLAYKGWYYIFIRYKIDDFNYTQWYNTNASTFVDDFSNKNVINYYRTLGDTDSDGTDESGSLIFKNDVILSTDIELSQTSFNTIIENETIDNRYNYFQLGYICVNKTSQKAFKTEDISITELIVSFNKNIKEYSSTELINSYYNYYNVKTLDNINNRIYIGNYNTKKILSESDLARVKILIEPNITNIDTDIDINTSMQYVSIIGTYSHHQGNVNVVINNPKSLKYVKNNVTYTLPYISANKYIVQSLDENNIPKVLNCNETDILYGHYYNGSTEIMFGKENGILAKYLVYVPASNVTTGLSGYYDISGDDPEFLSSNEITIIGIGASSNLTINTLNTYTYWNVNVNVVNTPSETVKVLDTNGIQPNSYYKFFIHFIDKYGEYTLGYDISKLNLIDDTSNYFKNGLFKSDNIKINQKLEYNVTIQSLPLDYVGAFISYEKFESNIIHKGIVEYKNNKLYFYNDSLNYDDSIAFNFNKIDLYSITEIADINGNIAVDINYDSKVTKQISNKQLLVADSLNNILEETRIYLTLSNYTDIKEKKYYAVLYNEEELYKNINKILIPASNIGYSRKINTYIVNEEVPIFATNLILNTKNNFSSIAHAIIYPNKTYFDNANMLYKIANETDTNKIKDRYPAYIYKFTEFFEVPIESIRFNNPPQIISFPLYNDDGKTNLDNVFFGSIVDIKNTVDLFKQQQVKYYDLYPKILTNYNKTSSYTNIFEKTIRRSHIMQDESNTNAWRLFNTEEYRNINENKGNITKLIGIGKYFIVHTEHSMFLFNGTDTIKSDEGGIQLASVDIINLSYQEVITSKLGYAGLQKEHHGIIGTFGYIFYSVDDRRLYRYDNNKLEIIDETITNFIKKNYFDDVIFVDDKERNRLIMKFTSNLLKTNIILSYNYLLNCFVSTHTYDFNQAYSTKNTIYLISKDKSTINWFSNLTYNNSASISIIINTNYEMMKYLDIIKYKINEINPTIDSNKSPVEGRTKYYPADSLQIYSEFCDTGVIDIDPYHLTNTTINSIENYKTPYWRFGNWHFSAIRDKLNDLTKTADEKSRIFGNWFVIKFDINTNNLVEFETLDCKFSLDEN